MPNRKTLPVISGKDVVKILCKNGFIVRRQTGSHIIIKLEKRQVVVPNHDEIDRGTLRSIKKKPVLQWMNSWNPSELNTKYNLEYSNGKYRDRKMWYMSPNYVSCYAVCGYLWIGCYNALLYWNLYSVNYGHIFMVHKLK